MRRIHVSFAALALGLGLGSCGVVEDVQHVSREISKGQSSDDIATGSPLSMPPDYSLRPPATSSSAAGGDATARRSQIVLRTTENPGAAAPRDGRPGPTQGERELLGRAGARSDTSDVVRKTVNIEDERRSSGEKSFTDRVLKYDPKAKPASDEEKPSSDATGDKPVIKRKGEL